MKRIFSFISLAILFFILPTNLSATHIAGGELTYVCTSPGVYTITLVAYRNCNPNSTPVPAPQSQLAVTIYYHATETDFSTTGVNPIIDTISNNYTDPCAPLPDGICLEKGIYIWENVQIGFSSDFIEIFIRTGNLSPGYNTNVDDPLNTGITYKAIIPPLAVGYTCHTSPYFNSDPPAVVCHQSYFDIDVSATPSVDSNTLTYEFFTPYINTPADPSMWLPAVGDFNPITWDEGFTADYSFGNASICPTTLSADGTINIYAENEGFYYNGVKVKEYSSNGTLISEINRIFTYVVANCNYNIASIEIPDAIIGTNNPQAPCGELTVSFENGSSNFNTSEWNFGDGNSLFDTTETGSPTYTYSDYGTYDITLVSYTDLIECADTTVKTITLLEPISGSIVQNDEQCLTSNSFDFELEINQNYPVTVTWNFGPNANQTSSTDLHPSGITFNTAETHTVTAWVHYSDCVIELSSAVVVFDGLIDEIAGPQHACDPQTVTFHGASNNPNFEYTWYIEEDTLTGLSVDYYFDEPGFYDIGLYVYNPDNGCESLQELDNYIEVFPTPQASFDISDEAFTIGEQFQIWDKSTNAETVNYSIVTDGFFSELKNPFYVFTNPGTHIITQIARNGNCTDQHTTQIEISPRKPIIPNAFTPNGDLLNDVFYINTHLNENVQLEIFDRWGLQVFSSDEYEKCDPVSGEYCWDGFNSINHKKCNKGHYFYIVKLKTGETYKGSIQLF
mgnify:CR=1 FL=1